MGISDYILSTMFFWMAWIIIPIIMELVPAIGDFFILIKKKIKNKKLKWIKYLPSITMIIPVYNSEATLYACIKSIAESDYPSDLILVMLVDNGGKDNSYGVFEQCRKDFPDLKMDWLKSNQGKSRALNMALFNSTGKYIIHIDSDGIVEKSALRNIVTKFENEDDTDCMTGTILTDMKQIDATDNFFMRLVRKIELFEYCQAFLAGRNFESESNSVFTLSGAFSAFRKSTILKTQLYNTDTVCEDTHVTFQVRENLGKKIKLCPNAIFFVDPIEDMNRLYTQRQRWQRGELEVVHMFMKNDKLTAKNLFGNFVVKLIAFDHTFAFPRMIWYFALITLTAINYPMSMVIYSMLAVYGLSIFSTLMFYIAILLYLNEFKDIRSYVAKKWYMPFLYPLFNFMTFWFRMAGIINSIRGEQLWKTKDLTTEMSDLGKIFKKDFQFYSRIIERIRTVVNSGDDF